MIIGIGTDIVEIARIAEMLEKHGDSFTARIFTQKELEGSAGRKNAAVYFSGRWAAKEALAKALGCGFGSNCSWLDIEILNNSQGKPEISLTGNAADFAEHLNAGRFHLSISHEHHYACATVLIES